jgi:hypothetical protein
MAGNRSAGHKLIERMAQDPDQLQGYLNLLFVGGCLGQVGDHASNIAEERRFMLPPLKTSGMKLPLPRHDASDGMSGSCLILQAVVA